MQQPAIGYALVERQPGLRDEHDEPVKHWQPLRDWGAGEGDTEALYWSNRLNTVSFVTRSAAIQFTHRHAARGCDEHLALYCRYCKPCERCGKPEPSDELHILSADGVDQMVCRTCDEAYERAQTRG